MSKEAMTLALEALERADKLFGSDDSDIKAVNALKEALALPNEKPMHPEIKKMYEDFFDKCFAESFELNKALKEALKQEQGEPVVGTKTWFEDGKVVTQNLYHSDVYTTPQPAQKPWIGLTDELREGGDPMFRCGAEWAERKLKEKNTTP
jgi:hypothetical protein